MKYPTLAHFSSLFTHFPSTPVENIRQIHPYLKKQTQFQKCKMMQAQYIQGIMKNIAASVHKKTNPIQTQFLKRTKNDGVYPEFIPENYFLGVQQGNVSSLAFLSGALCCFRFGTIFIYYVLYRIGQ
ncbi:MAG: hypothetical protein GY845_14810 [Planctomycetes bacterium]|nr:hypothetical protein [Planctomycetota bacterium]